MDQFQTPITTYEGFGINAAYTTPAYMANFRPAYSFEQDPYNPYAQEYPYSAALAESVFPFRDSSTFASDPMAHQFAMNKTVDDTHWDTMVDGATKWGTPIAAWWAANKVFNRQVRSANPVGRGFYGASAYVKNGFFQAKGHTAGMAAARAAMATKAKQSLGARVGAGVLGTGFRGAGAIANMGLKGLGFAGGSGVAAGFGAVGATLGSAVGGIALPILAAQAVAGAANKYVADPYISLRRNEDAMLSNAANTFVGGGAGTVMGGFGLSAQHASKLAEAFTQSGTDDTAFKREDMGIMADYAMQQGLMNDVGNMNVDDMKKRVANMADTVKLIMAVANTDSVKTAIEYMGRLKAAGITDPAAARRTMQSIGVSSAMSGVAVEQLMNTVGNQGQLMFQSQGLLPVLGQKAAIGTHAGFANAYKAGLISTENLAMMGGLDGATQNSMSGFLKMTSSQANMMGLHAGLPMGSGMVETMSKFGSEYAKNPFAMMGDMIVNGRARLSEQLASTGQITAEISALKQKASQFGNIFLDDDGNFKNASDLPVLMREMGLSDEEIRTKLEAWKSVQSPVYQERAREAATSSATRTMQQQLNQSGMTGFMQNIPGVGGFITDVKEFGYNLDKGSNSMMSGVTSFKASFQDAWNLISARAQGMAPEGDAWNYKVKTQEDGTRDITRSRLQTGFTLITPSGSKKVLDGRYDHILGGIGKMLNVDEDSELYGEATKIKDLLTGKSKDWDGSVDTLMAANDKAKGALYSRYDDETPREAAARISKLLMNNTSFTDNEKVDLKGLDAALDKNLKTALDDQQSWYMNNWEGDDTVVNETMKKHGRTALSEFMTLSKDHSYDETISKMFDGAADQDMGRIANKVKEKGIDSLTKLEKEKLEKSRVIAGMSGISSEEYDEMVKRGSAGLNDFGTHKRRSRFEENLGQLFERTEGVDLQSVAINDALKIGDGKMQILAEKRGINSYNAAKNDPRQLHSLAKAVYNGQEQVTEVNGRIENDMKAVGGMDLHFLKDFADATKAVNAAGGDMGRAAKAMEGLTQELREGRGNKGSQTAQSPDEVLSKLNTTLEEMNKIMTKNRAAAPTNFDNNGPWRNK